MMQIHSVEYHLMMKPWAMAESAEFPFEDGNDVNYKMYHLTHPDRVTPFCIS